MVENILIDDKNIVSVSNIVNSQGGIILRGKLDEILSEEFMPNKTEKYSLTNGICKCLSSILGKSYSYSCAYDIFKVVIEDLDSSRLLIAEEFLKKLKDNKIKK